jgi:hypothetical protein
MTNITATATDRSYTSIISSRYIRSHTEGLEPVVHECDEVRQREAFRGWLLRDLRADVVLHVGALLGVLLTARAITVEVINAREGEGGVILLERLEASLVVLLLALLAALAADVANLAAQEARALAELHEALWTSTRRVSKLPAHDASRPACSWRTGSRGPC